MSSSANTCLAAVVLAALPAFASAQVYRCGETSVYTDKPCDGATPVDLRTNILDAGTRVIPASPPPAPAIILPAPPQAPVRNEGSGTPWDQGEAVWRNRDQRESEHRSRTYRP